MIKTTAKAIYLVTLKWKQGEIKSLGTFRGDRADMAVLFDIPPAGDYDHELGTVLEPTEYLKQFGARLKKARGKRGVFIDAAQVDDERHKAGLSVHPLTELLERARLAESLAYPVTGPGRSSGYQEAVRKFAAANPHFPICIRFDAALGFDDFASLVRDLRLLVFELGIEPERCLLVADFGAFDPHDIDQFATNVVDRINDLPHLHRWLNLAVSMTAFPKTPKISAGSMKEFRRTEWQVYRRLRTLPVLRMPIFGDYALENPAPGPTGRISPVAQCRYSDGENHLIFKGKTTRKPNGYKVIFPVAESLVSHAVFMGKSYSSGDAYFYELATAPRSTGSASTWRWAATDHHLTQVLRSLRMLLGMPAFEAAQPVAPESVQLELI